MSKASELRLIRGQRSADAAINYHHRSGDSEGSGGSMLDFYAQEESAEETYFEEQEESAREVFSRAFRLYLKKTLTGKERKFLSRVLSGKEKPQEVGRALGVKWFEYLQAIQRKAFNNAEAFGRVVQLSGWSRAEEFADTVFKRFELLNAGAELNEILPQNAKILKKRKNRKLWREANKERINERHRKYRAEHCEEIRIYKKAHREEINARARERYAENREENCAKDRARRIRRKERDPIKYAEQVRAHNKRRREYMREWKKMHIEKMQKYQKEYQRKYQEANAEKIRERKRAYREANAEKIREQRRAYREANREKDLERKRAYRAKKKAEKEAAKALAGLLILSQTQGAETLESVSTME